MSWRARAFWVLVPLLVALPGGAVPAVTPVVVATPAIGAPGTTLRAGTAAGIEYLEIAPTDRLEAPLPMVVFLHGRGDKPRALEGDMAEALRNVRVILPRAPAPLGRGFTWLPVSVTSPDRALFSRSLEEAADRLATMLDAVRADRPTVGTPIVAGFSQGGMLAYALAAHHPQSLSLAIPIAGFLPDDLMPHERAADERYPSIRAMHAIDDPIVPLEPTQRATELLRRAGFDVELSTFDHAGHQVTDDMNALLLRYVRHALESRTERNAGSAS